MMVFDVFDVFSGQINIILTFFGEDNYLVFHDIDKISNESDTILWISINADSTVYCWPNISSRDLSSQNPKYRYF